jgi:hypothetical protein
VVGGPSRRDGPRGRQGFSLGPGPAAAAPLPATRPAESLLSVQMAAAAPMVTMEEHVNVILDDLGALQRALLSGDASQCRAVLDALAARRASLPAAAGDPALAEILDSLALRVEIEMARHGHPPPPGTGPDRRG